jgi:hypothetical protein
VEKKAAAKIIRWVVSCMDAILSEGLERRCVFVVGPSRFWNRMACGSGGADFGGREQCSVSLTG